jgi:Fe-S-cluster-containing hydrogenase component 2
LYEYNTVQVWYSPCIDCAAVRSVCPVIVLEVNSYGTHSLGVLRAYQSQSPRTNDQL